MKTLKLLLILMLIPSVCFGSASRDFDGANDNINVGAEASLNIEEGPVTISVWMNHATTGGDAVSFIFGKPQSGYTSFFIDDSTNKLQWLKNYSTTDITRLSGNDVFTDSQWEWVEITWDGGATATNIHIYVNSSEVGSYITTTSGSGSQVTNTSTFWRFGDNHNNAREFSGKLAYGQINNSVSSAIDREELRWKPCSIQTHGCWPMWGDSTEVDLSGNGNTGTVTGTTTSSDGPPVGFGGLLPL